MISTKKKLIISNINEYDEIIIAAHGIIGDTENCHSEVIFDQPFKQLFTSKELARFFNFILQISDYDKNKLNVRLSICYAARTQQAYANHIENPEKFDYFQSFAGCFVKNFHEESKFYYNIQLTAYTGAVSFNGINGECEIESEEQIFAHGKINEVNEKYKIAEIEMNQCVSLKEEFLKNEDRSISEINIFFDKYIDEKIYLSDLSPLGNSITKCFQLRDELFKEISISQNKQPEYGKIIYIANANEDKITCDTSQIKGKILSEKNTDEVQSTEEESSKNPCCRIF